VIYVDEEQCTGCGLCVEPCPTGAINLVDGVAQVEQSLCRECEVCLSTCPNGAILAMREPSGAEKPTPVRVPASTLAPARPVGPAPQPGGARPWLGAVLAFVGREAVPRVAVFLRNRGWQSRPLAVPYRASTPSRRNYGRWGCGRRARHRRRRGRW